MSIQRRPQLVAQRGDPRGAQQAKSGAMLQGAAPLGAPLVAFVLCSDYGLLIASRRFVVNN